MEGGKARRAVGPVKLLTSWCEPGAPGDTRDEWTYLAQCSKCAHTYTQNMLHNSAESGKPIITGLNQHCTSSLLIDDIALMSLIKETYTKKYKYFIYYILVIMNVRIQHMGHGKVLVESRIPF